MKPPIIRVSLAFVALSDDSLITFLRNVHALLYAEGGIPNPPVSGPVLLEGIEAFADSKAAQLNGGRAATAVKNNLRDDLLANGRKLAAFVQESANNDPAEVLSTGFYIVNLNRARYPLSKPMILRIVTGMTGEALVTMSTESIARGCEVRVAEVGEDGAPGEFRSLPFSSSSRNILVPGLTPGKLYAYQARTLGGSTAYSDWSDLVVQRAA